MFDDFREWLSDNLRYIFLGLAVILVIVLGAIAISIIRGAGQEKSRPETEIQTNSESELITETESTEVETQAETKTETDSLEKDKYPLVNEVVTAYLNAQKDGDEETYKRVVANANADHLTKLQLMKLSAANNVEGYYNISCYTKEGLEEGSYFTYIYYETKFVDAEEMLPGLTLVYIRTNEMGELHIYDMDTEAEVLSRSEELKLAPEIVALVNQVNKQFSEIYERDLAVQEAFNKYRDALTNVGAAADTPDTTTTTDTSGDGMQTNKVITVLSECSIRQDSRPDAELLGIAQEGDKVTRVRVLDNGWTEIKYGDGLGYIFSEYLSE